MASKDDANSEIRVPGIAKLPFGIAVGSILPVASSSNDRPTLRPCEDNI